MITDKKVLAETKRKMDLHVLLLMERHKITKTQAQVQAYHVGLGGLAQMLQSQGDIIGHEVAKK